MDAQRETHTKQETASDERAETGSEPAQGEAIADIPSKNDANVHGANIQVEQIEDFGAALAEWESGLKAIKEGDVVSGKVP